MMQKSARQMMFNMFVAGVCWFMLFYRGVYSLVGDEDFSVKISVKKSCFYIFVQSLLSPVSQKGLLNLKVVFALEVHVRGKDINQSETLQTVCGMLNAFGVTGMT